MKTAIKDITMLNRLLLGVTLFLYVLGVKLGFVFITHFMLGLSQVIFFLVLLFSAKKFTNNEKYSLLIYFIGVLLFFLVTLYVTDVTNVYETSWFLTSMGIAIYFTYVLEKLNKKIW